jgi:broad specificity phosphatase PhoE
VESAEAVLARVTSLLEDLRELQRSGEATSFLLCTHGDVASILVCASQGLPLSRHREIGAMGNAEVRRIASSAPSGLSHFRHV